MKNFWQKLSIFFETGDLVPFAVIISVYHYWRALQPTGDGAIAIAVAIFVDLLHFRTVRRAVQVRSRTAWATALFTTLMAVGYHVKFYSINVADPLMVMLYALPIPLGIAILAWQQETQPEALESVVEALGSKVEGLESRAKSAESRAEDAESNLKSARTAQKEAERFRVSLERKLNPLAKDVVWMVAMGEGTGQSIADQNGVSPAKVSKLKSQLNGASK